jgi:hypothetical protein
MYIHIYKYTHIHTYTYSNTVIMHKFTENEYVYRYVKDALDARLYRPPCYSDNMCKYVYSYECIHTHIYVIIHDDNDAYLRKITTKV